MNDERHFTSPSNALADGDAAEEKSQDDLNTADLNKDISIVKEGVM